MGDEVDVAGGIDSATVIQAKGLHIVTQGDGCVAEFGARRIESRAFFGGNRCR
jgi:hypothetical protein